MKEKFLEKIQKGEYISYHLFQEIEKNFNDVIPFEFDLEQYNNSILQKQMVEYREYFDAMYDGIDENIHLDEEQIKAILADEDYSLIIAGAGTGKTTTMASKVKYLVDIKKVNPSKILVMSYTKKATEELKKRIVLDFGIPAVVTTFHSLGMLYIREIFNNRKCSIVDSNQREEIFNEYFKEKIFKDKSKIEEILNLFDIVRFRKGFLMGKHFLAHYKDYETYDEYFEKYKEDKLNEVLNTKRNSEEDGILISQVEKEKLQRERLKLEIEKRVDRLLNSEEPITIQNELVKSKGEALIANFLFCNGIDYQYEKVYKELMPDRNVYRPDFTLELGGEEIYLEYFGLSTYHDGELSRYNKIRKIKEEYHRIHHTKFIKLDYEVGEDLLKTLKTKLIEMGFQLKPKSLKEIFYQLLSHHPLGQVYPYEDFLYSIIERIKSSSNRTHYQEIIQNYIEALPSEEKEKAKRQFYYVNDFYAYYQKKLYGVEIYTFDFSDMIYYANLYIDRVSRKDKLSFDYLIIDEYQDISQERYEFTKNIVTTNVAKIVAVGDDWQSIYAFAGSKIKYIYNFERYF